MSAKNRWQAGGGKAVSAARACNNINAGGVQGVTDEQFQRAKTSRELDSSITRNINLNALNLV